MLAVLAVIALAVAFILHLTSGPARYVADAEIIGWLLIAAHLAWAAHPYPWRRPPGTP